MILIQFLPHKQILNVSVMTWNLCFLFFLGSNLCFLFKNTFFSFPGKSADCDPIRAHLQ